MGRIEWEAKPYKPGEGERTAWLGKHGSWVFVASGEVGSPHVITVHVNGEAIVAEQTLSGAQEKAEKWLAEKLI